jgi:hypothetical protein
LLTNLEADNLGKVFQASSLDADIQGVIKGVPKGSAAHALGLVLIGLWGLFTGPTSSAQVALAVALASEQINGSGGALSSVPAMLELLYPGSAASNNIQPVQIILPTNALSIDRLALVCIDYIRLMISFKSVNEETRLKRLEASKSVQKATSRLRMILVNTDFVGLGLGSRSGREGEVGVEFEEAKERLVDVLSTLGRRAAGRATGRDEDSGLEGELEEL